MNKTKVKLILTIVFATITILSLLFGSLLYVDSMSDFGVNIFNISQDKESACRVYSIILFAVGGLFFVVSFCIFIFYMLAESHNKKTLEIIDKLKQKYAETKNVTVETIDVALDELVEEVKDCKDRGIPYIRTTVSPQQVVQVTNNYNQSYIPNQYAQTVTSTINKTTTTMNGPMMPPRPPMAPPVAPGSAPMGARPPMAPPMAPPVAPK